MRLAHVVCVATVAACGRVGFDDVTRDAGPGLVDARVGDAALAIPALVQANGCDMTASPAVCAFGAPVQAGDTIIVVLDDQIQTIDLSSITDSLGNPYTIVVGPYDASALRQYLAWAPVLASGNDIVTFKVSTAVTYELRLHELSGVAAAAPFDGFSETSGRGSGAFTFTSPPVTTTAPGDLLFAIALQFGPAIQPAGSFTSALPFDNDLSEIAIAGAPGLYTASAFTPNDATWTIVLAAFRAATR